MRHKRIIYLGSKLASEAVGSKESLEALAVVLSIKLTFVDSTINNATAVRMMKIMRIGHTRYARAVNYALNAGWLVRKDGKIVAALKLKQPDSFNIRLCFTRHFYTGKRRKADDITAVYTLTQLCNFIRQGVLLFHISKQATVYDTVTMATHPSKKQRRMMKGALKRTKRWGMCNPKLKGKADRLSYARMSEIAGCSKTKSKSLIKVLVADGVIDKHENFKQTSYDVETYRSDKGAFLRELHFEQKKRGCIVYHEGKVCVRLANSYTVNRNPVRFKFQRAI